MKQEKLDRIVNVRLPQDTADDLVEQAEASGLTMSDIVRMALKRYRVVVSGDRGVATRGAYNEAMFA